MYSNYLWLYNSTALNYNENANTSDNISFPCIEAILGCMNPSADNFNPNANIADGSCFTTVFGCTDSTALNYNEFANNNDGSCIEEIYGCMNPNAFNYDIEATVADGSCIALVYGCTDNGLELNGAGLINDENGDGIAALNYNPSATSLPLGEAAIGACVPRVNGCMNDLASNFDPDATVLMVHVYRLFLVVWMIRHLIIINLQILTMAHVFFQY